MLNQPARPTSLDQGKSQKAPNSFTGNHALQLEEPLLFECGSLDQSGVDFDDEDIDAIALDAKFQRKNPAHLPSLSEPQALRHYVRLSQKNYAIDMGLYPLGSCTMKHNPRLNEKMARLKGFSQIHPLQPQETVSGAFELMRELGRWLCVLTAMKSVALSPKAGAHGELCGMMAIKAAHQAKGHDPSIVLVPESAHGTNPATAAFLGYQVVDLKARSDGRVDIQEVKAKIAEHHGNIAAIMLTNPNTCGLFETDICAIAEAIHEAGGYFYCDGANFNAIVGKVRPGDLGIDAMHINLHKTFSTPHGGGGPGSGPVVLSERLAPFAPVPFVVMEGDDAQFIATRQDAQNATSNYKPFGRMAAFHGQMGMFVRALSYMMSHGADGLKQASEDAVLNANYMRCGLRDIMQQPFGDQPCMHEVLFDDSFLQGTDLTTLDFAKAMIDEGYHPMTMYFPLVAKGAMLMEPTESENRTSLDLFIATIRDLVFRAQDETQKQAFKDAPFHAPRRRLDETRAARKPILRWQPQNEHQKNK